MDSAFNIVALLLTILFGIFSIWAYLKTRSKVKLLFKVENCYHLFRDDINRLKMSISYNNVPLQSPILLVKGTIINTGKNDIDKSKIYKPLKIITTPEYNWLEFKVVLSEEINSEVQIINKNEVQILWDLFKSGEHINIEALVEIVNTDKKNLERIKDFYKSLSFSFRIENLKAIQKELFAPYLKYELYRKVIYKIFLIYPYIVGGLILAVITSFFFPKLDKAMFFEPPKNVVYIIDNGISKETCTIEYLTSVDSVRLKYQEPKRNTNVSILDFTSKMKILGVKKYTYEKVAVLNKKIFMLVLLMLVFILTLSMRKDSARLSKFSNSG